MRWLFLLNAYRAFSTWKPAADIVPSTQSTNDVCETGCQLFVAGGAGKRARSAFGTSRAPQWSTRFEPPMFVLSLLTMTMWPLTHVREREQCRLGYVKLTTISNTGTI